MKQTKTIKSFAELPAHSIADASAESQKTTPSEPLEFAEASPANRPDRFPSDSDVRGFHKWGINE